MQDGEEKAAVPVTRKPLWIVIENSGRFGLGLDESLSRSGAGFPNKDAAEETCARARYLAFVGPGDFPQLDADATLATCKLSDNR